MSEQIYCILLMMGGTVWFSYINGTMFSLLQTYDEKEAELEARFEYFEELRKNYNIDDSTYKSVR